MLVIFRSILILPCHYIYSMICYPNYGREPVKTNKTCDVGKSQNETLMI